jgi:squalene cyclase
VPRLARQGSNPRESFVAFSLLTLNSSKLTQFLTAAKHFEKAYRQCTKGGWPFSTPEQSYLVSDTTAEAMKAVMGLQELG